MDPDTTEVAEQVEAVVEASTEAPTTTEAQDGHPAWKELYDAVPADLHVLIRPHLEEFDRNVQKRFESINEKYKAWEPLVGKVDPDLATRGVAFLGKLDENPQEVYEAIAQHYGLTQAQAEALVNEQANSAPAVELDPDDPVTARIVQLESVLEQVNRQNEARQQELAAAEAQQKLDFVLSSLKDKHGDYDQEYVLGLMGAGIGPEDAVLRYKALVERVSTAPVAAPTVLSGSSNAVPATQTINPGQMSSSEVEKLVAEMLAASE